MSPPRARAWAGAAASIYRVTTAAVWVGGDTRIHVSGTLQAV